MAEEVKKVSLYKNILGDAKATIDAIQKFIAENSPNKKVENNTQMTNTQLEQAIRKMKGKKNAGLKDSAFF